MNEPELTFRSAPAPSQPRPAPTEQKEQNDIQARRDALFARAEKDDVEARTSAQREPERKVEPREDIESIEVPLADGRVVLFGPKRGVSLTMRVLNFPGDVSAAKALYLKTLFCVRAIDGEPVDPVTNDIEATRLANLLGDDALDILAANFRKYWPPVLQKDLPQIKKNLRG